MRRKIVSRYAVIPFSLLCLFVLAAIWQAHPYASVWNRWLDGSNAAVEEWTVTPKSVSFGVNAQGVLRATSVQYFGTPPEFGGYWEFQIIGMVEEGKNVKKGDLLISFDAQKVRDDLQRYQNELDQAAKELERSRTQIELENQELNARLANSEVRFQKLQLKQEGVDADLKAYRDVELDRLSLEQARREVEALKDRILWHQKSSDAAYKIIASKKARAEFKVEEIKRGVESFEVKSDRDGVIVFKTKWNNERYRVGENCYSGQPLMEIPDLNTIEVEAYVPEVDMGKIKIGERAEITVDALQGRTFRGTVKRIGTLVHTKDWDNPNKILDIRIALEQLDTATMRPSMTVRARVLTETFDGVLAIPLSAVRSVSGKTVVRAKAPNGWADRLVELGESNGTEIIVKRGLQSGERIAAVYNKAELSK